MKDQRNESDWEATLAEAERIVAQSDVSSEEFTLDGILAEYGDAPQETPEAKPEETPDNVIEIPVPAEAKEPEPSGVTLQSVLEQTVQSVLDAGAGEPLVEQPKKVRMPFRTKKKDTEELYDHIEKVEEAPREETPAEEPIPPEPPLHEASDHWWERAEHFRLCRNAALFLTAVMWAALAAFRFLPSLAELRTEWMIVTMPLCVMEILVCAIGRDVFLHAFRSLRKKEFTPELLTAMGCIVSFLDAISALLFPLRPAGASLHAVACVGVVCSLWGSYGRAYAKAENFRIAATDDPAYIVTITHFGAAKRKGALCGFADCMDREDPASRWQQALLPVIIAATFVFAVLATVECGTASLFLWNWTVLLTAANALSFPLAFALPMMALTRRVTKSGSALAGYDGADQIRRSNCVILGDSDLFPPGTVTLNGLRIFGEESGKVISYAASVARASESGLSRLFDTLLESDGGRIENVSELNFYEEGGVEGTIRGETVSLGTAAFCKKRNIRMPRDLKLKTGVFLAVDGTLCAVFAVKYMPAQNVDWALRALKHNRMTPVLAVRDSNITPGLLKRKFGTSAGALYPRLSTRLALSEGESGRSYAMLLREGLMPYAEVAVGAKRLVRAVRTGTVLSLLGSISGILLGFYFTFNAAYVTLTPINMLLFLGLWLFAALLEGFFAAHY